MPKLESVARMNDNKDGDKDGNGNNNVANDDFLTAKNLDAQAL